MSFIILYFSRWLVVAPVCACSDVSVPCVQVTGEGQPPRARGMARAARALAVALLAALAAAAGPQPASR